MNLVSRILEFCKSTWNNSSPAARVSLIAASVIVVLAVAAVGYWSTQPYYVPLTDNIGASKVAEVKEKLDSQNIKNKISYAGNSILVDQNQFADARLAVADILDTDDFQSDSNLGLFDTRSNNQPQARQREIVLAKKLENLKAIRSATVTLTIPKNSPFLRNEKEPTASVLVSLNDGYALSRQNARSIASIVSTGVEGMRIENVKVLDDEGNYRSVSDDESGAGVSDQLDMTRTYENLQAGKAREQLEALLGLGMTQVSVTAVIDFDSSSSNRLILDPDQKVRTDEESTTSETVSSPTAAGVTGTGNNLDRAIADFNNGQNKPLQKTEDTKNRYKYGQEERTEIKPPGKVERLSVSVIAEIPEHLKQQGADGSSDPTANDALKKQLEQSIKSAIGFDASRGDQFELLFAKLAEKPDFGDFLESEEVMLSPFWMDVIKNSSLAIAALVALVIGFMLIKRIQPASVVVENQDSWGPERVRQMSDMSSLIRENPELMTRIVAAWTNGSGDGNPATEANKAA